MSTEQDIFLSYSHRDCGIARDLVSKLRAAGLTCFIAEKDVAAGEPWEARIREALVGAHRVLLLITPRSKNSLWVAAEAGAAWALEKNLVACLMFVEPQELIEPIARRQARRVETREEVDALVEELAPHIREVQDRLTGLWVDPSDDDTVYFRQVGDRVVGFYDYGSGDRKVGVYRGILKGGILRYDWRWLHRDLEGVGRMTLSADGRQLSGKWSYAADPKATEDVEYHWRSLEMPRWLDENDFQPHLDYLHGRE